MEVIKKVESREDYKKWLLDTHGIFCVKGFSEEPNTSFMPNTAKLALVSEWLRDEKGLNVLVDSYLTIDEEGYFWWIDNKTDTIMGIDKSEERNEYNQVLSKGIEEALKLIDKAQ